MSESTSSMSDSTSHDNGESPKPKPPPNFSLCLWRLSDIFILVMSLTGAAAGRQQHRVQNASLTPTVAAAEMFICASDASASALIPPLPNLSKGLTQELVSPCSFDS